MRNVGYGIIAAVAMIGCVVVLQLKNPITRNDLGIAGMEAEQPNCSIPTFENFNLEFGTNANPNPNSERVSNEFLPFAVASLNAYRKNETFILSNYDQAWKSVDTKMIGLDVPSWNGFDLAVFTRETATSVEVLVAFRGTDEITLQSFVGIPDWLFGNASWMTQWVPWWDQYRSARTSFQSIRAWSAKQYHGRQIFYTVTGHSLGGGLSQHIARAFPCVRAVAFNSSCVTNEFRLRAPFKDSQIVLISEDGDPLTHLCKRLFEFTNSDHVQVYDGANMVLKAAKGLTIQHSMEEYSAGMSRSVICCAQRRRLGEDSSCSCDRRLSQPQVDKAVHLFCGENDRAAKDEACDFKTRRVLNDKQCVSSVKNC